MSHLSWHLSKFIDCWYLRDSALPGWNQVEVTKKGGVWAVSFWINNYWVRQVDIPTEHTLDEVKSSAVALYRMGG